MKTNGAWIREALADAYYDSIPLITINLLWFLLTLLLVTAPPAAAGLYYATNRLAHRRSANWRTFFEGFRAHFWLGWRWVLTNLLVLAVLLGDAWFYGRMGWGWGEWVQGFLVGLAILWGLLQIYTFPLLLEQQERRMLVAVRNSAVLYLRRPLFSIGLALVVILLIGLSTWLLPPCWLFFTASLSAFLANRGTIVLIESLQ